ncbi:MAG: MATE family efflux transporter [Defluviitaleaceae bacterium]|nr:MATE family efflux transporter [Defluviitaleaceae bacterium]
MTKGRPMRLMINFATPLLFANVLQLMFTIADSAVVGRMLGVDAFASVGATASANWLALAAVIGLTQGFGTVFAQRFGAGDTDGLRKAFTAAVYLTAAFGVLLGIGGAFGAAPMLSLLGTPDQLMRGAVLYLSILLGGIVITFAYNMLGATLRALGDSVTPFKAMVIGMVLNIALSIALCIPFGIAGVAAATLLSQTAACAYCVFTLRKTGLMKGCDKNLDIPSARALLRLGLPLFFRNAVIEVGGLAVQWYVNRYGVEFVAGIAAAKRMYSLLLIIAGALETSVATFAAQNFGAENISRVKQGVVCGMRLMFGSSLVIMAITLIFGRFILGLLITGDPGRLNAVLDVGTQQLTVMALGLPILSLLFLYRSALQGIGNTVIPMLSGFLELVSRISSVIFITPLWGEWGVYLSDISGWTAAALLLTVSYYYFARQLSLKTPE